MITAWIPDDETAAAVSRIQGVTADVYDGGDKLPDSVADVEFYSPGFPPTRRNREVLGELPSLKVLQLPVAGVELYRPYLPEDVTLCNARGVHDAGTAEWAVGAMIAAQRDFPAFALAQRDRRWDWHFTGVLTDSTVLIVGYGSIGAAIERRLLPFEVEVIRVARSARDGVHAVTELPGLLPLADIVVLIVPATPDTIGLADQRFLGAMKAGALLVNAARGTIVDTGALVAELGRGRLRAALDVTDPEPLPVDHPLWSAPGVFITPHVAGSTPASKRRVTELVRAQLIRYVAGEPLVNVVTGAY